jgi:hypothetical protein
MMERSRNDCFQLYFFVTYASSSLFFVTYAALSE